MSYGRLVIAAVVATIVDAVYGFCVYGFLMKGQYVWYPGVFRPSDMQPAYMPFLFGGILVAMLVAAWMYSKGYEGGTGVVEGARFGAAIGVFVIGYVWAVNYAMMNLGRRIVAGMALAGFIEWVIAGIVIGLVYKPRIATK